MKSLLVPVDFSDYSYNACLYALHLASHERAKVTVFHAYHIPIVDPLMPSEFLSDLAESAEKDVSANMEKLVNQLKDYKNQRHLNDFEISSSSTMGFAVDEIVLACERLSPDIIVMGRRFTEGMTKILLGSITSSIVEKSPVPVLVIPENVSAENPITDVLYASEFNDEDKRALKYLLEFCKPIGAKVHCVHVEGKQETSSQEKMKDLEKQFITEEQAGQIEFQNIQSENVTDGLLNHVESKHDNLMAMLTHRRSFFVKLFDRSLTTKVAFKTNIPLMVFHD